jgi:outer membrane protein assembly factor BamB
MRFCLYTLIIIIFQSCEANNPTDFVYSKNQDWTSDFQNNSLPSKTYYKHKVYCSSLRIGLDNYLYCLNLKTGKVDWVAKVKNWATNPPIVNDSLIYSSSYTGDLYRFDLNGKIIWERQTNGVFKSFCINPWNGNLMVTTTTNGLYELNSKDGEIVKIYANNSFAISTPIFFKNQFFIAGVKSEKDTINLMGRLLVAYNSNRSKEFEVEIGKVKHLFLSEKKLFYLEEETSKLICFDLNKRKILWQMKNLINVDGRNIFFSDSKIYIYEDDLNNIYEIDKKDGLINRKVSYSRLLDEKVIINDVYNYTVVNNNEVKKIKVTDSLENPVPLKSELNIYIN